MDPHSSHPSAIPDDSSDRPPSYRMPEKSGDPSNQIAPQTTAQPPASTSGYSYPPTAGYP